MMTASFTIERQIHGEWRLDGVLKVQLPFANTKFNFVLELTASLADWLQKSIAPPGIYRIGEEDTARIEWNGVTPKVLVDVRTLGDGRKNDARTGEVKEGLNQGAQDVIEAEREKN